MHCCANHLERWLPSQPKSVPKVQLLLCKAKVEPPNDSRDNSLAHISHFWDFKSHTEEIQNFLTFSA